MVADLAPPPRMVEPTIHAVRPLGDGNFVADADVDADAKRRSPDVRSEDG